MDQVDEKGEEEEFQPDPDDHHYDSDTGCPKHPLILNSLFNQLMLLVLTPHHHNIHSVAHYTIIFTITTIIEFNISQKLLNFLIVHHQQHYLMLSHFTKERSFYYYSSPFKQMSYLDWLLFLESLYFNWKD